MATDPASARARQRIRVEMERQHLSQTDLAGRLQWTQTRVSKILNGRVDLGVDDLDALCFAVGIRITEAVRDTGVEFCAEMSPTELRFLEVLRTLDPQTRDALFALLHIRIGSVEKRGITKSTIGTVKKVR